MYKICVLVIQPLVHVLFQSSPHPYEYKDEYSFHRHCHMANMKSSQSADSHLQIISTAFQTSSVFDQH